MIIHKKNEIEKKSIEIITPNNGFLKKRERETERTEMT